MVREEGRRKNKKKRRKKLEIGILATLLLFLFRIPLARMLGDEANGYLAIAWEIYSLFYLLCGFGYSKALSQLVKNRIEKGSYQNSIRSLGTVMLMGMTACLTAGAVLYGASSILAGLFPGAKMVEIGLKVFAILLPCSTALGIIRGYFEGIGSQVPTDLSRFIEATVAAAATLIFQFAASDYGQKVGALLHDGHFVSGFAAAGVVIGYLCASLLSFLFLCFVYAMYKTEYNRLLKKEASKVAEDRIRIVKETIVLLPSVLFPVIFIRIYRTVNLYLYGRQLTEEQMDRGIAAIGSFYGKSSVLLSLAVVIILAYTGGRRRTKKLPSQKETRMIKRDMEEELRRLFAMAFPTAISCIVLAESLLKMLYKTAGKNDSRLLMICAASLIFISLGVYLYHLLHSLGMVKQSALAQMAAMLFQTMFMVFWVKTPEAETFSFLGVSLAAAELSFWIFFSLGQLFLLLKTQKIRLPLGNMVTVGFIKSLAIGVIQILITYLLKEVVPPWVVVLAGIGMGFIGYELTGRFIASKKG